MYSYISLIDHYHIDVVVDRLIIDGEYKDRLTESVELALKFGSGAIIIHDLKTKKDHLFSEHFGCTDHPEASLDELSPRMFSFNSPYGACQKCDGLGSQMNIDPNLLVPDKSKSLIQGAIIPLGEQPRGNWYGGVLKSLAKHYDFNFTTPWMKIDPKIRKVLLFGTGKDTLKMEYSSERWTGTYTGSWEGAVYNLERRYSQTKSSHIRQWIEQFMSMRSCPECEGTRLKKESRSVKISENNLGDISAMTIKQCRNYFNSLNLNSTDSKIAEQILKEINSRLGFLVDVGLEYLTLERSAVTLSGGEAQRIRLATQIGSQLMGVLYILDEPSIGLHPRDNSRLLKTLKKLRDIGNSVIVVEHDRETMLSSDYIIDIGPGAGEHGGEIVYAGEPKEILNFAKSLTGKYLSGKESIPAPTKRRLGNFYSLSIKGANGNNLKNINVDLPLGKLIVVTGVSGSGKSTLINETLFPAVSKELYGSRQFPLYHDSIEGLEYIDKILIINQSDKLI